MAVSYRLYKVELSFDMPTTKAFDNVWRRFLDSEKTMELLGCSWLLFRCTDPENSASAGKNLRRRQEPSEVGVHCDSEPRSRSHFLHLWGQIPEPGT